MGKDINNKHKLADKKDWPKTCSDAVFEIINNMDTASISLVIETKFTDLIMFNRLWGIIQYIVK